MQVSNMNHSRVICRALKGGKDKQLREENLKPQGKGGENLKHEEGSNMASSSIKPGEQCLKQLEEKLDVDCNDDKTRLLGVVGMA
ncbi:hypothetical protein YC2023_084648 [Brassica napus]